MQAFISLPVLDPAAFIALLAFAIALPILVGCIYIDQVETQNKKRNLSSREQATLNRFRKWVKAPTEERMLALFAVGEYFAFGGIIAAFWHASWIIGLALLISTFVVGWIYMHYLLGRIRRMNKLDTPDTNIQVGEITSTDQQS
jgi:hypothetical protein